MSSVNASRICGGVTFAVVAVALAAITAVALAIIFAPPFLAAYAAVAIYISVGCGIGAAVATLAAFILLRNRSTHSPSNSNDTTKMDGPGNSNQIDKQINEYLAFVDKIYTVSGGKTYTVAVSEIINKITNHNKFNLFKERYDLIVADLDLTKDETARNATAIYKRLESLVSEMDKKSTEEPDAPAETKKPNTTQIEDYLTAADTIKGLDTASHKYSTKVRDIMTSIEGDTVYETVKEEYFSILEKFDITKDPEAKNADQILNELCGIYNKLIKIEDDSSEGSN